MPAPQKTMLQQVMKTSDYVKLACLVVFSAVCWVWVWYEYQKPLDLGLLDDQATSRAVLPLADLVH